MGTIFLISCSDCSYREEEVLVGWGMMAVGYEAMVCADCRRVMSVPVGDERPEPDPDLAGHLNQCPECGGQNLQQLPLDEDRSPGQRDTGVPCPSSLGGVLLAQPLGIWD